MTGKTKMRKKILGNEEGFGLVESLIAIILAGVASVALISVAVGVIREANNNQIRDAMNYYAVQGLEEVRAIAAEDSDFDIVGDVGDVDGVPTGVVCPTVGATNYGRLDMGDGTTFYQILTEDDRCTKKGAGSGDCEKLTMPGGDKDFLYREISLKRAGGECYKQRVTVTVGMIANDPENDSYPRGFISEVTIVGYIAEH